MNAEELAEYNNTPERQKYLSEEADRRALHTYYAVKQQLNKTLKIIEEHGNDWDEKFAEEKVRLFEMERDLLDESPELYKKHRLEVDAMLLLEKLLVDSE